MTEQRAKEIAILIWSELAETGDTEKEVLVEKLYLDSIINQEEYNLLVDDACCPLCVLFRDNFCDLCPLGSCESHGSLYANWRRAEEGDEIIKWAKAILERIKGWEVQE